MAKKVFALVLVIITVISCMILPTSAATSGNSTRTQTITVNTKSNWWIPGSESITLSQSKTTFTYYKTNFWGTKKVQKEKSVYAEWSISVYALDGSHSYTKTWKSSSIKLSLKPNKTYQITVSYKSSQDVYRGLDYLGWQWKSSPSWKVKSTYKVSSYC